MKLVRLVLVSMFLIGALSNLAFRLSDPLAGRNGVQALIYDWMDEGDQVQAWLGGAVSGAGDVNGDGYDDVIVGAIGYDGDLVNEGQASVYYGSPTGLTAEPAWSVEGDATEAYLGNAVAAAGDVNGDGYDDVIVGVSVWSPDYFYQGAALAFYGSAQGLSTTPDWMVEGDQEFAMLGASVASAGDVNGDGYDDVIVASPTYRLTYDYEGAAFVYYGSVSGLLTIPSWTKGTNQPNARIESVSTAGDVNGDGYDDVIVGSLYYDQGEEDEGRAWVYNGSATGLSTTPSWTGQVDQAYAHFGADVSTAGDVNGDGYDDVLVGAHWYDGGQPDSGAAFVYHGSSEGVQSAPSWHVFGDQSFGQLGLSLGSAGDVNADGYDDVIVGTRYYDAGVADSGKIWVYQGSPAGLLLGPRWSAASEQVRAFFGSACSGAGDVNGDDHDDVIVGATGYANGESSEGAAYVFHGPLTRATVYLPLISKGF